MSRHGIAVQLQAGQPWEDHGEGCGVSICVPLRSDGRTNMRVSVTPPFAPSGSTSSMGHGCLASSTTSTTCVFVYHNSARAYRETLRKGRRSAGRPVAAVTLGLPSRDTQRARHARNYDLQPSGSGSSHTQAPPTAPSTGGMLSPLVAASLGHGTRHLPPAPMAVS